jgi:tape measure domain-containing protein
VADAGTAYIEFRGDYSAVTGNEVTRHGRKAGDQFAGGFGSSLRTGLGGAASTIAAFAKNGALLLGGIAVAGGAWGLSIAAQGEQAQIAFETMLGSGEKAKAFLDELKAFAASTPFEFPQLQTAASSLIAAGFAAEDVIPIMTTLGDVTSGMGTGAEGVQRATVALQQMAAAGRITGEDLNQLRDAGIPVFDLLASATGKSKEEISAMAQAGKLGRVEMEQLFEALRTGGGGLERFSGLMEQQSQSLAGLFSTLKDTLGQGLADALAPVIPLLKEMLPNITDIAGNLTTLFGGVVSALAPRVLPLLEKLADLLTNVLGAAFDALQPVVDALGGALDELLPILGGALLDAIEALAPIFPIMADAIKDLTPLLSELIEGLGVALVDALNELVPVMAENAPQFVELAEAMLELAIAVLPLIGPLASLLGAFSKLQAFLAGSVLAPVIRGIAAAIRTMTSFDFAGAFGRVQEFFSGLPPLIGRALSALPGVLSRAASTGFAAFVRGVRGAFPAILSFLAGQPGRMVAAMGALAALLIRLTAQSFARMLSAVQTGASTVVGFARRIPGMIVGALQSLPGLLFTVGVGALNRLRDAFANGIGRLIDTVRTIPGRVAGALGDLGRILYNAGRELIAGLIDGIKSAAGSVADAVADVVPDWVPGFGGKSVAGGKAGLAMPGLRGTVGLPDTVPVQPAGDFIIELDGYEIGRAPGVYRGISQRAKAHRESLT